MRASAISNAAISDRLTVKGHFAVVMNGEGTLSDSETRDVANQQADEDAGIGPPPSPARDEPGARQEHGSGGPARELQADRTHHRQGDRNLAPDVVAAHGQRPEGDDDRQEGRHLAIDIEGQALTDGDRVQGREQGQYPGCSGRHAPFEQSVQREARGGQHQEQPKALGRLDPSRLHQDRRRARPGALGVVLDEHRLVHPRVRRRAHGVPTLRQTQHGLLVVSPPVPGQVVEETGHGRRHPEREQNRRPPGEERGSTTDARSTSAPGQGEAGARRYDFGRTPDGLAEEEAEATEQLEQG
jgi:hypothetical protein